MEQGQCRRLFSHRSLAAHLTPPLSRDSPQALPPPSLRTLQHLHGCTQKWAVSPQAVGRHYLPPCCQPSFARFAHICSHADDFPVSSSVLDSCCDFPPRPVSHNRPSKPTRHLSSASYSHCGGRLMLSSFISQMQSGQHTPRYRGCADMC